MLRWALAVILLGFYFHHIGLEFDTRDLIRGNHALMACGTDATSGCASAGPFVLLQRIPALILASTGMKDGLVLRLLAVLSFASFILLLRTAFKALKKISAFSAYLFLLILLSGPFLVYARSSFGESLAALCILSFTVFCSERASPFKILVLMTLAGISKDTAAPFLILLGFSAFRFDFKKIPLLIVGGLMALALNAGFNQWRYSAWVNTDYLNPLFLVHDLKVTASFFLGQWFSPNGGLVFFWPLFAILLAFAIRRAAQKNTKESGLLFWHKTQAATPAVLLLLLTFGLSRWYAPLGWDAWGPRLLLPWIPALTFLLLLHFGKEAEAPLRSRLAVPKSFRRIAFFSALLIFPQFYVLFDDTLMQQIFARDAFCPTVPVIQLDSAYYYRCLQHEIWPRHSILWSAYNPLRDPLAFALACVCAFFWFSIFKKLRTQALA